MEQRSSERMPRTARRARPATAMQAMYRSYLRGWASDYLGFRAAHGRRACRLGRCEAPHDAGPMGLIAGPRQ